MKYFRTITAALVIAYPAHAVDLPDLGEVSRVALSEAREDQIGREIMRQIRDSAEYLDDPVLTEYLGNLGDRLVAASPTPGRRFEFFPVRDASINAFALPGGYVGVHTGLISAARNESELAGVLAHEISHVTQNHIARIVDAQKNSGLISLLALAVAILAARSDSQVSQAAMVSAQAYNVQNQLNFTREHEREADRVGLQILSATDYSPQGMASFFERLQTQGRLYENNAPSYLRTHPLTYERIADIQGRLSHMPYHQHADSLEFTFVKARVQAAAGDAAEAVRRFEAQTKYDPDSLGAWYGLAMAAMRTSNLDQARRAAEVLVKRATASPLVTLLNAEILLAQNRPAEAITALGTALQRQSAYRPLVYLYARSLLRANRPQEALAFITEQQRTWLADHRLNALLSETYQALGKPTQAHLAQAEAYALLDRTDAAIEQLQLAQKGGQADFYTLSIIDARLRELKERRQPDQEKLP